MPVTVFSFQLATANSSLPVVQQAARNRRVGADNQADRMTIWLQNVESESSIRNSCHSIYAVVFIFQRWSLIQGKTLRLPMSVCSLRYLSLQDPKRGDRHVIALKGVARSRLFQPIKFFKLRRTRVWIRALPPRRTRHRVTIIMSS